MQTGEYKINIAEYHAIRMIIGGFKWVWDPRSTTLLYKPAAIPAAMKFSSESTPIPTPAYSFGNVVEIDLDIVISMADCPALPQIKKTAMSRGEMSVKVEKQRKTGDK